MTFEEIVRKFNNRPVEHSATQAIIGMIGELGEILDLEKKRIYQQHDESIQDYKEHADLKYYQTLWHLSNKDLTELIENDYIWAILAVMESIIKHALNGIDMAHLDNKIEHLTSSAGYDDEFLARVLSDKLHARYPGGKFNREDSVNRNAT